MIKTKRKQEVCHTIFSGQRISHSGHQNIKVLLSFFWSDKPLMVSGHVREFPQMTSGVRQSYMRECVL